MLFWIVCFPFSISRPFCLHQFDLLNFHKKVLRCLRVILAIRKLFFGSRTNFPKYAYLAAQRTLEYLPTYCQIDKAKKKIWIKTGSLKFQVNLIICKKNEIRNPDPFSLRMHYRIKQFWLYTSWEIENKIAICSRQDISTEHWRDILTLSQIGQFHGRYTVCL